MPQPSAAQLHVDRWLTNLAVAWTQEQDNFVAQRVFPPVPVQNESDFYLIYDRQSFYRAGQIRPRPLNGRPANAGYEVKQGAYRCIEYGLEHLVDDRVRQNADQPADPDLAAMRMLMTQGLIQRETLWTNTYFATGIWGTDWTGVSSGPSSNQFLQWDQSGSDPIQFIRGRRNDIASKTGYMPNKIVFGPVAYEAFINHPDVTDRIKYTNAATAGNLRGAVTSLLDLNEVLVPYGVSNTAAEGANESTAFIQSPTSVLLCYAAPSPTIDAPSAGYTFAYTGLIPGLSNATAGVIERGREELAHTDVFQWRASYTMNVVASELGEFFQTVVGAGYSESTF